MPEICPIYLELAVVIHVHKLMGKRVFHMLLVYNKVLANGHSPRLRLESSRTDTGAWRANNVLWLDVAAMSLQVVEHEDDGRACDRS